MSAAVIEFAGVTRRYGDQQVLDGVDLRIADGELVGMVGPGGGGKTVLLKIAAGLVAPDDGSVRIRGHDLSALGADGLRELRRHMGMLFQNYALFDFLPVAENAAFPLLQGGEVPRDEALRRASALLAEVGLAGSEALFPNELSGGMKKRVGLARATIHEPTVVLYDDPTAGLDPVTSSKIFRMIRTLHDQRGSTDLVVGHDVDRMKRICDRFVVLDEGRIRFDGPLTAAEASTDPTVAAFFRPSGVAAGPS